MSTLDTNVLKANNPQSLTIGNKTYYNIVSLAVKCQSVDGGDTKEAQTVVSGKWVVGWTHKPCEIEIVALIDGADILKDLQDQGFWGSAGEDNTISTLRYVDKHVDKKTRNISFTPAIGSVVSKVEHTQENYGKHYTEVTIKTSYPFAASAWT